MLLSVIIPVYNVEKYLRRCIESVLNQNIEKYEILLIDDGSTDNSSEICDTYGKKYKHIKVFHKENGGLSDARNYGLNKSQGRYISFVDSDDFIIENTYEKFINIAIKYNLDIITGNKVKYISNNEKYHTIKKRVNDRKIYTGKKFLVKSIQNKTMSMSSVLNIYKKEIISNNDLYFKKNLLHEDELWTPQVFLVAEKVMYLDFDFYMHYERKGSITQQADKTDNAKDLIKIVYELEEVFDSIENEKDQRISKDYLSMLYLNAVYIGKFHRKEFNHLIDKKFVIKNSYSMKNKLKAFVFFINKKFYFYFNQMIKNKK